MYRIVSPVPFSDVRPCSGGAAAWRLFRLSPGCFEGTEWLSADCLEDTEWLSSAGCMKG